MAGDEYLLDTPVVRQFVAAVRASIDAASSPQEACAAIRPRFAELLADQDWLPDEFRESVPDSGMGGGEAVTRKDPRGHVNIYDRNGPDAKPPFKGLPFTGKMN
jgi:predicted metal-dependent enzyme (double-stranded beta helix superfamily)